MQKLLIAGVIFVGFVQERSIDHIFSITQCFTMYTSLEL